MSTLKEELKDSEYRRAYAESFANTMIATQIRLLRGDMTQQEFGELVGVKQSRISAMEDENYSSWSTKSLKQIAGGKDVVFLGRFVSFGELLGWSTRFSKETLTVPSYRDDILANSDAKAENMIYTMAMDSASGVARVFVSRSSPMIKATKSRTDVPSLSLVTGVATNG
jgi:predicted XRE-type DNA-binding protein